MSPALTQAHEAYSAFHPTMEKARADFRAGHITAAQFMVHHTVHQRLLSAIDDAEGVTARAHARNLEFGLPPLREGAQRGYAFGGRDTSHDDEDERATEAACFGRQDP